MNGVQLVVAVHDGAERATPDDVGGAVPIRHVGITQTEAGLQFTSQRAGRARRLKGRAATEAQDQAARCGCGLLPVAASRRAGGCGD